MIAIIHSVQLFFLCQEIFWWNFKTDKTWADKGKSNPYRSLQFIKGGQTIDSSYLKILEELIGNVQGIQEAYILMNPTLQGLFQYEMSALHGNLRVIKKIMSDPGQKQKYAALPDQATREKYLERFKALVDKKYPWKNGQTV